MICRLCLRKLHKKCAFLLIYENNTETNLAKIIKKFFFLRLAKNDPISVYVCEDCREQLEEFHSFWLYIEKKQNLLAKQLQKHKKNYNEVKKAQETSENIYEEEAEMEEDIQDDTSNEEDISHFLLPKSIFLCEPNTTNSEKDKCKVQNIVEQEVESSELVEEMEQLVEIIEPSEVEYVDDDSVEITMEPEHDLSSDEHVDSKEDSLNSERKTELDTEAGSKQMAATTDPPALTVIKQNEAKINQYMELVCDLCEESMINYSTLRKHFKKIHDHMPYVKCCDKIFYKASYLVEHITLHQDPDAFTCKICYKSMSSAANFAQHMKMLHDGRSEPLPKCNVCNKVFKHRKWFTTHMKLHENTFCELCDKNFPTKQSLQRHIDSVHNNIFPHICDTCGQKFKYKPSFVRHTQLHEGLIEESMQCEICDKWFKNKHSLRIHVISHNSAKVECDMCGRMFPGMKNLKRHINKTHNTEKSLQCLYCEKTFKFERNLKEHIAVHTGVKLYSCPHCNKESRSQSTMYVHIKRFHFKEWHKEKIARSNNPHWKSTLE